MGELLFEDNGRGEYHAEYKSYLVTLKPDFDLDWPDVVGERLGTIVTWHRSYVFDQDGPREFGSPDSFLEFAEREEAIVLDLYLYDHSGISISTSSGRYFMSDPLRWDWGQVGYVYATREKVLDFFRRKKMTDALRKKARAVMEEEIKEIDEILIFGVWGYSVSLRGDPKEIVDSSWGHSWSNVQEAAWIAARALERDANFKPISSIPVPVALGVSDG